MRKQLRLLGVMCITALLCYACGNKQTEQASGYSQFEKPDTTSSVQRMKDYHYSATIENGSEQYTYDITRKVDDTQPTIMTDEKIVYADNYINLKVKKGETDILNKTFTKALFKSYLDKEFYDMSILEGMAFNKTEEKNLCFVASVSHPDTDLFVLFSIKIAPDGSYVIDEEDNLEMNED